MFEILLLIIIVAISWFWMDTISKREIAITVGKELAKRCDLQLLDETVACNKIWLARDSGGRVQIARLYEFEVSADRESRLGCHLQLLGRQLQDWHIPPYLQNVH
ncbi:MAG: DUF3301 domain-containing protein [Methylophilaceae bacterium]